MKKKFNLENLEIKSFVTTQDSERMFGGQDIPPGPTMKGSPECILGSFNSACGSCECDTEIFCGTDFLAGCQQAY